MPDTIAGLVPAVKLQLGFFGQYGSAGIQALEDTVRAAKQRGLLVIADGKRNDVPSTSDAYAAAFLGETEIFGEKQKAFDVDAMTVTPYLGRDSLLPFVGACRLRALLPRAFILVTGYGAQGASSRALPLASTPAGWARSRTHREKSLTLSVMKT